jgi:tRNA (guanine-N7-)-methyltransferase
MRRSRRLPLEQLAPYLLPLPREVAPLKWREVFGNGRPAEIEVGFGKGLFLLTSALARPDTNFLGIEIARKYQLFSATRMAKRGLSNVRLACADARNFLRDYVATGAVRAVHVYFPDPWWKHRHQKRRLFTAEFAAEAERVLEPGGRLYLVTDVGDYFRVMTQLVAEQTHLRILPASEPGEPAHDLDYLTNFERKFRKEGRTVYRAVYEKVSPSAP